MSNYELFSKKIKITNAQMQWGNNTEPVHSEALPAVSQILRRALSDLENKLLPLLLRIVLLK